MTLPIPLLFDMDDVTADTNGFFVSTLKKLLPTLSQTPEVVDLCEHLNIHDDIHTLAFQEKLAKHSPHKAKVLNQIVWDHLLSDGVYMTEVQPNHGLVNYIKNTLAQAVLDKRVVLGIVTHRGFHPHAEDLTMDWLDQQGIGYLFEDIHVLDFNTNPDKYVFLCQQYGERFYLVDDNPIIGTEVLDHRSQLIIYTNGRKHLPRYAYQARVSNERELNAHLTELGIIGYY